MTGAEILRAEGEATGRAEGEVRGEAKALLRVLERRGVVLSEGQRATIEGCRDLEQLERWLDRALTVTSGEELFG